MVVNSTLIQLYLYRCLEFSIFVIIKYIKSPMKNILTLILLLYSLSTPAQKINVDTEPVQRFYDLMEYIEHINGGKIKNSNLPFEKIKIEYQINSKDTLRQQFIDSLLETRPYSHKYMSYVKAHGQVGKDAYRTAYNILGKGVTVNMTAGMPNTWVRFWNSSNRNKIDLIEIKNSIEELEFNSEFMEQYLPKNGLNNERGITIYFTVDGNRGAYQEDSIMVFDLTGSKLKVDEVLEGTFMHELHHIYYEDWLDQNITSDPLDDNFRAAQLSFIKEGLAQFMNFDTYPQRIQKLYSNKKLLGELFDNLCVGEYDTDYATAMKLLKRYIFLPTAKDRPYRPTVLYYLSYNIYKSIEVVGGKEMIDFVIANPEELITTYNSLYDKNIMLFGPLPKEFELRWRANL